MGQIPTKNSKTLKTKLLRAVRMSDTIAIDKILSSGKINVNGIRDHKNSPLLCVAVRRSNPEVVVMLLNSQGKYSFKENTDKRQKNESVSRISVIQSDDAHCLFPVVVMNSVGLHRDAVDDAGGISCESGEEGHGVDVNVTDRNGMSPIHITAVSGNAEITRILIDHGADVNKEDALKAFPLHAAAAYSHLSICRVLVENGARINCVEKSGLTPLHLAVITGGVETVRELLYHGAWPDVPDYEGRTPLHFASVLMAYRGLDDIIRTDRALLLCLLLLQYGSDVTFQDDSNCSPLLYATLKNNRQLIRVFLDHAMFLDHAQLVKLKSKFAEGHVMYTQERSLLAATYRIVSLRRLCRTAVMCHMTSVRGDVCTDSQLLNCVNDLELPVTLTNFLKYKE